MVLGEKSVETRSISSFDLVDLQESGERVGSEEEEGENLQCVQVERKFILPQNKESQVFWNLKSDGSKQAKHFLKPEHFRIQRIDVNTMCVVPPSASFCGVLHVEVVYNVVIRSRLADESCKVILLG